MGWYSSYRTRISRSSSASAIPFCGMKLNSGTATFRSTDTQRELGASFTNQRYDTKTMRDGSA